MARKPMVSYDTLKIGTPPPEAEIAEPRPQTERPGSNGPPTDYLIDIAQQVVIYLNPAAHKTLARYALEQSEHRAKVRVHDLLVTAIEEFFERRGLPGPVRAKEPARGSRAGRGRRPTPGG